MPPSDFTEGLFETSRTELNEILRWLQSRGESTDSPITVLVGGWAVYAYNPLYQSIDIDLVTNSQTKQHLMRFLRQERGFAIERYPMIPNTVYKPTPYGNIEIDFASRQDTSCFEGREEQCDFNLVDGRTIKKRLPEGTVVIVPTRALLLLFKLKAFWDRSYRLSNGTSPRPEYEQGKIEKDIADIIALLNSSIGYDDLDLQFLGEKLHEYPFLMEKLESIPERSDAIAKYGRLSQDEVRMIIKRLLPLIT